MLCSLSKGFGLIERFSEDLDVKLERGAVTTLPEVSNWRSEGKKATAERRAFFAGLRVMGEGLLSARLHPPRRHCP